MACIHVSTLTFLDIDRRQVLPAVRVKICKPVIHRQRLALSHYKPLRLAVSANTPPTLMQTSSVSVCQPPTRTLHRSVSALALLLLAGAGLLGIAPQARADDGRVILSTGLGAVAGALIGQSVGGRNATIVGGALGAAIGASAATEGGYRRGGPSVTYSANYGYGVPVAYAPPVVYVPATVYQPVYQPIYQPAYQPIYRTVVRPVIRPIVYPIAYYGAYRSDGGYYDSDDRRHDDRGWDNNRRGGWDRDQGNRHH